MAFPIALQSFEPVARQVQVRQRGCDSELVELEFGLALDAVERLDAFAFSEIACPFVAIADDHDERLAAYTRYVKRNDVETKGS